MANPFKPTAGMTPPVLIGREDDLEEFEMALDNGVGDLGRLAYVTGPRGIGKTALLNAYGDIARDRKWDVIDETACPGFESLRGHPQPRPRLRPGSFCICSQTD